MRPGHFVIVFQYVLYCRLLPRCRLPAPWGHLVVYIGFSDWVRFMLLLEIRLAATACSAAAALVAFVALTRTPCEVRLGVEERFPYCAI